MSGPGAGGRQAAQVAAGIFLTRVLGYVRELLFAHYLGNDWAADAFRVALRIPNTIRNLLGEGTLAGSFIPVYAAFNERPDKSEARALAGAVLGLLLLAASALALVGIAAAPALVTVFGAGLQGQSRALAVALMRILFPMSGLMVISAWCLGVLNTHRKFFLSYALAWGTVAGAVLQVAAQLPACRRALGGLAVRFSWRTSGVRDVVVAWLPLLIGAGVAQISGLIDTLLGTLAGEGGASSLGYAQLLQVLPISLFGASVAQASLPELSRDAIATGGGANEQLRSRIAVGFRRIAFFVLPSAFLFAALGPVLVAALFQTGRFAHSDSILVGGVIAAYGVGLLGQATVKLFASGFYALRDTRTPVKIAAFSLAVGSGLGWLLLRWFGPAGIALGSSVGGTLSTVLHLRDLDRRIGAVLRPEHWWAMGAAVLGAGAAALAGLGAAAATAGLGVLPRALAAVGIFGVVYAAVTALLRHPDALRTWRSLTSWRAS